MIRKQPDQPSTEAHSGLPPPSDAAGEASAGADANAASGRKAARRWLALAGMVFSLALACVIVEMEFSAAAIHRADRVRRRWGALSLQLRRLQAETAADRAQLAAARRELEASAALRTLLLAPDVRTIRLAPPRGTGAGRSAASPDTTALRDPGVAGSPGAILVFSPHEHRAVLQVANVASAAHDRTFMLWWRAAHGSALKAAEFRPAADGGALVALPLPDGFVPAAAMVTAESAGADGSVRQGGALLRGELGRHG